MILRTPLIAGNWKMFKTVPEAAETAQGLVRILADDPRPDVETMLAPSFVQLDAVSRMLRGSPVRLAAQDLFWESRGAFTGAISAEMLLSAGCSHVLVGHSERRQYFGETDEIVNKKILAAAKAGLSPVLCVGETEEERESGKTFSVLDKQVRNGINNVSFDAVVPLVLAYEPVWAIGTGKTASSGQAQEVHEFLRETIRKARDDGFAEDLRILYGGSVKPGNISELMDMPDIDGALVGGASLDAETFSEIVRFRKV